MNIEWKDSYCIDNERIDVQHRQLFAHANAVFSVSGKPGHRLAIMQLYAYIRTHFADEEALMREVNFPRYKVQLQLHEALLSRLNAISSAVGKDEASDNDLRDFMTEGLLQHIIQEDSLIAAYVRKRSP
jgi:hemerythrin